MEHEVVIINGRRYLFNVIESEDETYVDTMINKWIDEAGPNAEVEWDEPKDSDYRIF